MGEITASLYADENDQVERGKSDNAGKRTTATTPLNRQERAGPGEETQSTCIRQASGTKADRGCRRRGWLETVPGHYRSSLDCFNLLSKIRRNVISSE